MAQDGGSTPAQPDRTAQPLDLAAQAVKVLQKHAGQVDHDARFPIESLQALRDLRLLGLLVPRSYGGLGGGIGDLVDVAMTLASGCLSTALIWAMHSQQVDAIVQFATPELKQDLLPRIAAGDVYIASVTSEAVKGGHLLTAMSPLATRDNVLYLERDAPVVTGGLHADGFLITMRRSAEATPQEVSLVYADRTDLQLDYRVDWNALGMRGTESIPVRLVGQVPNANIVGRPGGFREVAIASFIPSGHLGWAACWLGTARAAFSELIQLIRSRRRPAGIDPASPLVAERLARIRTALELVSAYLGQVRNEVLALRTSGKSLDDAPVQLHINTLKVIAAEFTFEAVDRMIQLGGLRLGYTGDSPIPLERHFRDLRSASLNYANDRLLVANGALTLLDRQVRLV